MTTLRMRRRGDALGRRRAWLASAAAAAVLASAASAAAQDGVCGDPTGFCGRSAQSGCLERFGAGAFPASGEEATEEQRACAGELSLYRDCLSLIAAQCAPSGGGAGGASIGPSPSASALDVWNEIKGVEDPDVLEAFAESYPASPLAVLARKRAAALRAAESAAAAPAETPPETPSAEDAAAQAAEDAAAQAAARAEQEAAERAAAAEAARLSAQFREAQGHLNRIGYDAGPVDGVWGAKSSTALERFLRAQSLPVSRVLTPESLALLRAAPSGSAAPARPATSTAPATSDAPAGAGSKPALKDKVAVLSLEFKYKNLRRDRCSERIPVATKALRLSQHVFEGCSRDTWVRLMTEEDGSAPVSVVSYGTETIRLNGSRWRYSGRSFETSPRSLRSVTLTVEFQDR